MKLQVFKIRLSDEYLIKDQEIINDFLESSKVWKTVLELVKDEYWSVVVFYEILNENSHTSSPKLFVEAETELTNEELDVYQSLKQLRFELSTELNIPAYMIANNKELMSVAKFKPTDVDDLFKIRGFAENKIAKYGENIINFLNQNKLTI
jgi:superfamily II DNA helicase RecQ